MRRVAAAALAALALFAAAPAAAKPARGEDPAHEVRRTAHHGEEHREPRRRLRVRIRARQHLLDRAEYVTVNADRSRFFGPDETWFFSGNGSVYRNLDADFYFQWVKQRKMVEALIAQKPPNGPLPGVRKGVRGYVRGYNQYLRDTGVDKIPDRRCRGEEWVRPITKLDVYRRFFQLGILASSGAVIDGIAGATHVEPTAAVAQDERQAQMLESGEALQRLQPDIGSNAYGFGREATDNGRGLVLGNPHFPWDGSERLYQSHLRIPGEVDVAGGSLYGVPLINIGHTRGLAWSHTVATAWRFTPFKLQLAPGDPHSYVVDGETKPMEATEVKVGDETRTIYSTEWGPMIDDLVGIPLPWTEGSGFALKDVNVTNFRYLNHFIENNRAQSVAEYDRIQRKYQGIPWVNSLAADSKGNAYYTMQGAIPYVPDELAAECNVGQPAFATLGLPILDGSRSECDWRSSDETAAPGTFPPDEVPTPDPAGLRHERKRQPLALESRGAAHRIRPHHRNRGGRADAADAARADPGRGPARRRGRPAGQPLQPPAAPDDRGRQPPVRRRAVA